MLEDVMKNSNIVLIATPSIIFENIVQRITSLIEEELYLFHVQKELN
jgi:glycerol-3-phosphate dehydrogenase